MPKQTKKERKKRKKRKKRKQLVKKMCERFVCLLSTYKDHGMPNRRRFLCGYLPFLSLSLSLFVCLFLSIFKSFWFSLNFFNFYISHFFSLFFLFYNLTQGLLFFMFISFCILYSLHLSLISSFTKFPISLSVHQLVCCY